MRRTKKWLTCKHRGFTFSTKETEFSDEKKVKKRWTSNVWSKARLASKNGGNIWSIFWMAGSTKYRTIKYRPNIARNLLKHDHFFRRFKAIFGWYSRMRYSRVPTCAEYLLVRWGDILSSCCKGDIWSIFGRRTEILTKYCHPNIASFLQQDGPKMRDVRVYISYLSMRNVDFPLLPGGTAGYPAHPRLISLSVRLSVSTLLIFLWIIIDLAQQIWWNIVWNT